MSYQRSNAYDALPSTISNLKQAINVKFQTLKKASDELISAYHNDVIMKAEDVSCNDEFEASISAETNLVKSLQEQVISLHEDYKASRLNYARFKDKLVPVKEFLDANPKYQHKQLNKAAVTQILSSVFPENTNKQTVDTLKSDSYENLISRVEKLRQLNNSLSDIKPDQSDKFKRTKTEISLLCAKIYQDFRQMRSEFESGALYTFQFTQSLDVLRLLIQHLGGIDKDALHAGEILDECQKFQMIV